MFFDPYTVKQIVFAYIGELLMAIFLQKKYRDLCVAKL